MIILKFFENQITGHTSTSSLTILSIAGSLKMNGTNGSLIWIFQRIGTISSLILK
jgi:hypothetical protein